MSTILLINSEKSLAEHIYNDTNPTFVYSIVYNKCEDYMYKKYKSISVKYGIGSIGRCTKHKTYYTMRSDMDFTKVHRMLASFGVRHDLTSESSDVYRKSPITSVKQLVVNIVGPDIYRTNDNNNKSTFDFIKVGVSLKSNYTMDNIETFKPELDKMVLSKIAKSKRFQRYEVPISILELSNCTLLHDGVLEYIFQLKKQLCE